eukprot:tig00000241_g20977.t1
MATSDEAPAPPPQDSQVVTLMPRATHQVQRRMEKRTTTYVEVKFLRGQCLFGLAPPGELGQTGALVLDPSGSTFHGAEPWYLAEKYSERTWGEGDTIGLLYDPHTKSMLFTHFNEAEEYPPSMPGSLMGFLYNADRIFDPDEVLPTLFNNTQGLVKVEINTGERPFSVPMHRIRPALREERFAITGIASPLQNTSMMSSIGTPAG